MNRVTFVSLNAKEYYSPAPRLLIDYAMQDELIRTSYAFNLVETSLMVPLLRRAYVISMREHIHDLFHIVKRYSLRIFWRWLKNQVKYSKGIVRGAMAVLWWKTLFRIIARRPDIVGFSCYLWNIENVLQLAKWIKRVSPRTIVILGGQEVTNSGDEILRDNPCIDFIVDGEGEETFRALLTVLLSKHTKKIKNVPGLVTRHDHAAEKRKPIENLNVLPVPVASYRNDPEMVHEIRNSRMGYMVETSRGCPFKCSFCFESDKYKTVRHFPLAKVADEILGMSALGIKRFHILDPVLCNSDPERLRALTDIIRQAQGGEEFDFSVEIYAELLKEEMMESLRFFNSLDVGLQSYNPHVLKKINRYFDEAKFARGIDLLKKINKLFNVFLIFGLPGETLFSFMKTLRYVMALNPPVVYISHLYVLRGTPLRRNADRDKLEFDPMPPYRVRSTAYMSAEDVESCSYMCNSFIREYHATSGGGSHAEI